MCSKQIRPFMVESTLGDFCFSFLSFFIFSLHLDVCFCFPLTVFGHSSVIVSLIIICCAFLVIVKRLRVWERRCIYYYYNSDPKRRPTIHVLESVHRSRLEMALIWYPASEKNDGSDITHQISDSVKNHKEWNWIFFFKKSKCLLIKSLDLSFFC